MMKITGLSHLFKWENLHNWWLTKYFFAPLYGLNLIDIYCKWVMYIDIFSIMDTFLCHKGRFYY